MIRNTRSLAICALLTSTSTTVLAQQSDADTEDFALEEIIVTAQKREQSLQDVPIAVSAFSGGALETRAIEELVDLQMSVPNLLFDQARVNLRGVGNNAISSTAESGLGYHVNGVYLNAPVGRNTEYFDIERIEVLRGPQGTLYGRNTTAGVLNIITRRATDEFGGDVSIQYGNYDNIRVRGALNVPVSESFRQRFAGIYVKRDGYNTNIFTGNDVDGRDSYAFRSTSALDVGDNFTASLVVNYLKEDSNRASETKGTCTKDPQFGCSALDRGFETPDVTNTLWNSIDFLGALPGGDYFSDAFNPPDFRTVNIDQEPITQVDELFISLEMTYDFGDLSLTSVTGYQDLETYRFQDFDRFVSNQRLNFPVTYRADFVNDITTDEIRSGRQDILDASQFSQELRLASDFDGDFNFLIGAFYFEYDADSKAQFSHPVLSIGQNLLGLPDEAEFFSIESEDIVSDSFAIFGEGYYDMSEQTRLTVGVRHTWDDKAIKTRTVFWSLPDFTVADADWSVTTGKLSVDHRLDEDHLIYGTVSRGYKAGGLNPGGPAGGETFDPEFLYTFEIGSKSTFLDGRLTANLNAFYYDYKGLQIGAVRGTSVVTVNADADIKGLEAELNFAATDRLFLDMSFSYLDVTLDNILTSDPGDPAGLAPGVVIALDENGQPSFDNDGNIIQDIAGNTLRNAPNFSFKIGGDYTWEIPGDYALRARVDYAWQDDYFANEFNKPTDRINSWSQADAQLVFFPVDGNWSIEAYMKNIFDNDEVTRIGQDGPLVGRFRSVNVLEPRTYGLELNYTF